MKEIFIYLLLLALDFTTLYSQNPEYSWVAKTGGVDYDFNGRLLQSSGIYYDTLQSISGCDSIITLDLTGEIVIFDITGKQLLTKKLRNQDSITIITNNLLKGEYIVRISLKDESPEFKLLIIE